MEWETQNSRPLTEYDEQKTYAKHQINPKGHNGLRFLLRHIYSVLISYR